MEVEEKSETWKVNGRHGAGHRAGGHVSPYTTWKSNITSSCWDTVACKYRGIIYVLIRCIWTAGNGCFYKHLLLLLMFAVKAAKMKSGHTYTSWLENRWSPQIVAWIIWGKCKLVLQQIQESHYIIKLSTSVLMMRKHKLHIQTKQIKFTRVVWSCLKRQAFKLLDAPFVHRVMKSHFVDLLINIFSSVPFFSVLFWVFLTIYVNFTS